MSSSSEAELLANYRLHDVVARGRLSVLYRGEAVKTGELVAVKVLTGYACQVAEKLTRKLGKDWEGVRAMRLQHPNVVRTLACGKAEGRYYIVMEFLQGGNLSQLIHRADSCLEGRRVELVRQAVKGLGYVHRCGIIHRDVCTKNVMLTGDGVAKLIDFGVAANKSDRIRNTGQRTGRASHMAPELIRTNRFDERTDLFALGVAAYETLTAKRPFHTHDDTFGTLSGVLNTEAVPPRVVNPAISPRLEAVMLRALAPERSVRYGSCDELLADLERVDDKL
jgi:eukaryotic-like serine/threonine-protein kinase